MVLPTRKYSDLQYFRASPDQSAILEGTVVYHDFTHCIEIITSNPDPPPPPDQPIAPYHVLLDGLALRDRAVAADLFSPSTLFATLSPISSGNGLFVRLATVTFSLTPATYSRFGLSGKRVGDLHFVTLAEHQRGDLLRIRPCEPIEGLLLTEHIEVYEPFLRKFRPVGLSVESWSPARPFSFDVGRLQTPGATDPSWRADFCRAVDRALLERGAPSPECGLRRTCVRGFFSLRSLAAWLESVGRSGWSLLLTWDMTDVPGAFVGARGTLQGVGGGCEAVLYGAALPQACRFQTVRYAGSD